METTKQKQYFIKSKVFVRTDFTHDNNEVTLKKGNTYIKQVEDSKNVRGITKSVNNINRDKASCDWMDDPKHFLMEEKEGIMTTSPMIQLDCYGESIDALIDTGSNLNCLREDVFERLNVKEHNIPVLPCQKKQVSLALKNKNMTSSKQALLDVCVQGVDMKVPFLIVKNFISGRNEDDH